MANSDTVRRLALGMSHVNEKLCYGTPGFYVKKKLFARLLEDGETVVLKIDPDERERRLQADPEAFFVTEHYLNYPMMIVRLSAVLDDDLQDLLQAAWERAS